MPGSMLNECNGLDESGNKSGDTKHTLLALSCQLIVCSLSLSIVYQASLNCATFYLNLQLS